MIAVFFASCATDGVSAASSAEVSVALFSVAVRMLPGRDENSTDRSTAVPSVPPIWRKNVDALVATPMSFGSTEFWLAMVSVCMSCPRPETDHEHADHEVPERLVDGQRRHPEEAGRR